MVKIVIIMNILDNEELEEIKEVVRMTRLGQMLLDEGMEYGRRSETDRTRERKSK